MNLGKELMIGVNTTIISMGIVFLVLIILSCMIIIEYRILEGFGIISESMKSDLNGEFDIEKRISSRNHRRELTKGKAELLDLEDEEIAAVIMAAVSEASRISFSSLRIGSIKRINSNWEIEARKVETD